MNAPVAALFVRADSIYKTLDGVDAYDATRDALTWQGGCPTVAHPPCRAWGRLRAFAKPRPGERELALWAVEQVRRFGGVLEHPAFSTLWQAAGLPRPEDGPDAFGGWTLAISQHWWGHKAEKLTWLYIVGIEPGDLPPMPFCFGDGTHVTGGSRKAWGAQRIAKGMPGYRPEITKAEREHTPPDLARWLVAIARRAGGAPEAANDNEPPQQRQKMGGTHE